MVSVWKSLAFSMAGALSVAAFISTDRSEIYVEEPAATVVEPAVQSVGREIFISGYQHVDCALHSDIFEKAIDGCPPDQQSAGIDNLILVTANEDVLDSNGALSALR